MILDTNALSAFAEGEGGIGIEMRRATEIAIPVIVLGEYRYGIRQSRYRAKYEAWLEELLPHCRVLDVDKGTAAAYADIRVELRRQGRPIPGNDAWIAALALQYAMAVLSRDTHFDVVPGLRRISW